LFTQLGDIRNRGIELSLSGALTQRLRAVAGAVLLDPQVTGDGVRLGRVGARPVGLPKRRLDLSLDWQVPVEGISLDARIVNLSRRPATTLNGVFLPDRTLLDLGGRYRFKIGKIDATLRVSLGNVFDVRGFDTFGSGTYDIIGGRTLSTYLAADF
jgi:iron complex outermembrane recepter protein